MLSAARTSLSWKGRSVFRFSPPRSRNLEELRANSESFAFDVRLGTGYWKKNPGSVHVAIRWTDAGGVVNQDVTGDLFSLVVVDSNDRIVAKAAAGPRDISAAQSVDIEAPRDGRYEALVLPYRVRGRAFEGVVVVRPDPPDEPMPDLVTRQPDNFSFRASTGQGSGSTSCLDIEVQEHPGLKRCLRFDARISNAGTGTFLTEADITDVVDRRSESIRSGAEPEGDSVQVLVDEGGKERRLPTGRWAIDKEHAHTHIVDLAEYELRRVSDDGEGAVLVTDEKIGFCPWDLIDERFGKPASSPRVYPAFACSVPEKRTGSKPVILRIGISPGWADVYPARRPAQYLDATGLEDGVYDVVVRVDPNQWFEEADRSNNEATTRIRLAGDAITCVPKPFGCPKDAVAGD